MYQENTHDAPSQIAIVMHEPSVAHLTCKFAGVVNLNRAATRKSRTAALNTNRKMVSATRIAEGVVDPDADRSNAAAIAKRATTIKAARPIEIAIRSQNGRRSFTS